MFKYCIILLMIAIVNARATFRYKNYENNKEINQLVSEPTILSLNESNRSQHSIHKRDAFDNLLELDEEPDMEIYRDMLVGELTGADRTLFDRKLDEAESMRWKHRSGFHRYAIQIFDEVKRYHDIRSNVSYYNV